MADDIAEAKLREAEDKEAAMMKAVRVTAVCTVCVLSHAARLLTSAQANATPAPLNVEWQVQLSRSAPYRVEQTVANIQRASQVDVSGMGVGQQAWFVTGLGL